MTALQKQAWFNLAVVVATLVLVLSLYPQMGAKAMGGFGLFGLVGLGVLFQWRRRGRVVTDERDTAINRVAIAWSYAVLWATIVACAMLAPTIYGDAVPMPVVQNFVWWAFMLLITVQSIVTLIVYRRGAVHVG
jgi:hypothetical protein